MPQNRSAAAVAVVAVITVLLALSSRTAQTTYSLLQEPAWMSARMSQLKPDFPPTPNWATTPASVGQVGSGETPKKGQDINVLGGGYKYPDYVRRFGAHWALVPLDPQPMVERFARVSRYHKGGMLANGQAGQVERFASVSRHRKGGMLANGQAGQQLLIPMAAKLWGGEYSSVGKFPKGFKGQRTYGGEWNVWANPTAEQMAAGDTCGENCIDSPLQSIGEHNVLQEIGNDADSSMWNADEAIGQPSGKANCCGDQDIGLQSNGNFGAPGYEEPSHAWLSA